MASCLTCCSTARNPSFPLEPPLDGCPNLSLPFISHSTISVLLSCCYLFLCPVTQLSLPVFHFISAFLIQCRNWAHLLWRLKCPTCVWDCTLDGCLHFRHLSPLSLFYVIEHYRYNHNCLDSHTGKEADQSVWVEASLRSHRFSAVKVFLSLAYSLWTQLVLLSEQISIAQHSKTILKQ